MSEFVFPDVGKHEDQELDFKAQLNTKDGKTDYLELAKDMAAMANAYGGTIIIGACEDPKGVLSVYKPMTEDVAVAACNEYKTAQRDRLRPTVIVVPETHPLEGGFLVTVKIEPSMGQAIGVRFVPKVDVAPETKEPPEIFGFPVRVGDNTTWLQPEQLPMLMLPELRRTILLLRKIGGNSVKLDVIHKSHFAPGGQNYTVEAIEPDVNVVRFSGGFSIAIDQIESIFRKTDGWRIRYVSGW